MDSVAATPTVPPPRTAPFGANHEPGYAADDLRVHSATRDQVPQDRLVQKMRRADARQTASADLLDLRDDWMDGVNQGEGGHQKSSDPILVPALKVT